MKKKNGKWPDYSKWDIVKPNTCRISILESKQSENRTELF